MGHESAVVLCSSKSPDLTLSIRQLPLTDTIEFVLQWEYLCEERTIFKWRSRIAKDVHLLLMWSKIGRDRGRETIPLFVESVIEYYHYVCRMRCLV